MKKTNACITLLIFLGGFAKAQVPSNDNCANAITLSNNNSSCSYISGTVNNATNDGFPLLPSCDTYGSSGSLAGVFYTFTALNSTYTITVDPTGSGSGQLDAVVVLYTGSSCFFLNEVSCMDTPGGNGITTTLTTPILTSGTQYWIRVYDWGGTNTTNGNFQICLTKNACTLPNAPSQPSGVTAINFGQTYTYTTNAVAGATSYTWTLLSSSGRTFIPSQTTSTPSVQIQWTNPNTGQDILGVFANNACGAGPASNALNISFNGGGSAPVANFSGSPTTVTAGGNVNFMDASANSPTSWTWSFPGGTPSSSTAQNPSITYNTAGTYNVSLTATNSFGNNSITKTGYITVNSGGGGGTISIASSVIPPWQRQDDSFQGSVNAVTQNPSGASWHLEIYKNGSWIKSYTSTTGLSTSFNSSNFGTSILTGDIITYKAVLDANGFSATPLSSSNNPVGNVDTKIINKKLNLETVVYYNDGTNADKIKIPINYSPSINYNNVTITFSRVTKTAAIDMSLPPIDPPNITGSFNVSAEGYAEVFNSNSIIESAYPGEFDYNVYHGANWIEAGRFSLVKIGRMGNIWNNNSSHVVVGIGGTYNTLEQNVESLGIRSAAPSSEDSYSLLAYIGANTNCNIWYIGQGNVNTVQRNGYDIGVALEEIQALTNATEIDIITHSKGGLDTRAFIQNHSLGLDGSVIDFSTSSVSTTLNKLLFLGTPHRGSDLDIGVWASILSNPFQAPQGVKDLLSTNINDPSKILYKLNHTPVPGSIQYANLTGFVNGVNLTDVLVNVPSSENPIQNCLQMYQNDFRFPYVLPMAAPLLYTISDTLTHMMLHHNNFISQVGKCTQSISNLDKILSFIQGNSTTSCVRHPFNFEVVPYGSLLPGASVSIKSVGDSVFQRIGLSDENSKLSIDLFDIISLGDSLKIEAAGYETLILVVNSEIIATRKIHAGMLKSLSPTTKIKYPSLKLVNQNPITSNSTITFQVSGENVLSYQINQPFNQDSVYVPLSLSNNQFTAQLDTGDNLVIVRLIGQADTFKLAKQVSYLPGTLINDYASDLTINTSPPFIGAKLYIDNIFIQDITSISVTTKILKVNHDAKFSLLGYRDTIYTVDSTGIINLVMQPMNYASEADSAIIEFTVNGNLQYWKNITVSKTGGIGNKVILKQSADTLFNTGFIPMSNSFEFINNSSSGFPVLNVATCLDQIARLSKDSTYLLITKNDTAYIKAQFDSAGICNFDSLVQKLTYNPLNFDSGNVQKQEIRIMKRLAPVAIPQSYIIVSGDSILIPFTSLFSDPDSVKNDMTYSIVNGAPTGLIVTISNAKVVLKASACWAGSTSFGFKATHDALTIENIISVNIIRESLTWKKVAVGYHHTLALKSDGSLWAWGKNDKGQIGDGTNADKYYPVRIGNSSNWISISCGGNQTFAIKSDGTLWGWGWNDFETLGDGSNLNKNAPVQIGNATDWSSVSSGRAHTLAIKTNGTLWGWGYNSQGQLGDGSNIQRSSPVQIGNSTNWVSIVCGSDHTLGIKSDGTLWSWGINGRGELGDGTTTNKNVPVQVGLSSNWASVAAGEWLTIALKSDGSLWAWGRNNQGNLGLGNTDNLPHPNPSQVSNSMNWKGIACYARTTAALKTDSSLWAWGSNSFGEIGDGSNINRNTPTLVTSQTGVLSIASSTHGGLIKVNDDLICMTGYNGNGQLGNGTTTNRNTHECVVAASPVVTIITNTISPLVFCSGASVNIPFTTTSNYCDIFIAQLSNATGSFANPVTIGSLTSTTSGTIAGIIPANTPSGTGYRIRVVSSYPVITGTPNTSNITINAIPTATITPNGTTTFCTGGSVILNANTGPGLTYVWKNNGSTISGATSPNYTATTTGNYTVVVTNSSNCFATSTAVSVTVGSLSASITPAGTSIICAGSGITFTASTGTGYTYQWYRNGVAQAGANNFSFNASSNGTYYCLISSAGGCSGTSNSSIISVTNNPVPVITYSTPLSFCSPGSVLLTANTFAGVTYQWQKNSVDIAGATSQSYSATTSGTYRVKEIANGCYKYAPAVSVTTVSSVTATIAANGPVTFCTGGSVVLSVTGAVPGFSYQWKNNNVNIPGATLSSYTATASGSYSCLVSASCGSSTSNAIVVSAGGITANVSPSGSVVICTTATVSFSANTGSGFTYQWQRNGINIAGATSSTYNTNTAGNYSVSITSPCGNANSSVTTVTVSPVTAAISPNGTVTICAGSNQTLTANTGYNFAYQWYRNGAALTGSISQTYSASSYGSYTVKITQGGSCSSTSSITTLSVTNNPTPVITAGGSTTFCAGQSVTFTANTFVGVIYQWQKNGSDISGATLQSYIANSPGSYRVKETANGCFKYSPGISVVVNCRLANSTTDVALEENSFEKFQIYPNPNYGSFSISYQLGENSEGGLRIYDTKGNLTFNKTLPVGTTLQTVTLPLLSQGIYNCVFTTGKEIISKRIAVYIE